MQLSYLASGIEGYERIIGADSGLRFFREHGILRLIAPGSYDDDSGPNEIMLHIVRGNCTLTAAGLVYEDLGKRDTIFDGKPTAVYIPPETRYRIEGREVEIVISRAAAQRKDDANGTASVQVIKPADLSPMSVGKDNWQRTVTMIAPPDFPSQSLIVGETINPSGNWSGVPAHKHDQINAPNKSIHEEIYYFRIPEKNGWGCLRIYDGDKMDEVIRLRDRAVTIIPKGYHTVVAAPGTTMLYTFHLAGPQKKLVVTEDPDQAWIKQ